MDDGSVAFQRLATEVEYPVFVVTAAAPPEVAGCLVGFTTQCSIEPLRMLVCLSQNNYTWEVAQRSRSLAVHLVRKDQHELAELFGGVSAKDQADKMDRWSWTAGPDGVPILDDCDWFVGKVLSRTVLGDHTGFLLEPTHGDVDAARHGQLGYGRADDIEAGQPAGVTGRAGS
ncbi:MAG TPA: flavin reductase family protein [Acidimicrobiia bacterium]|nr:flavin reductase family protein [Acidimicrobiia bacterium]